MYTEKSVGVDCTVVCWEEVPGSGGLLEWSRLVGSFWSFQKLLRKVHRGPGCKGKTKGVRGIMGSPLTQKWPAQERCFEMKWG
jgi:hypothetical protein